ncbi:IS21 family transposase [Tibeticola sp.]|jgi:transposase|uniref:IS21 family transposase n=1 Tax=Tibeticola sp. TaxID=2005368 RepID=UPI002583DC09|nr:IS21 family transposase [Tibeticola sp.]MCI4440109.1 IS21 family transposase [Tibeticola sp.]
MIPRALETEILRLHQTEHWPVGTIAAQLRVHHSTVRRVLAQAGAPAAQTTLRPSIIAPYRAFIVETLTKYPTLRASRVYTMVRERGYPGGPDHLRALVAQLRPRPAAQAYLRLRTLPGEQAQVDWAHFGKLTVGRAVRPLMAFVMVLSYSRQIFLRFYPGAAMNYFIRGHVEAFGSFNSVPRVLLYDNLKSAVLERSGDAIRFHPTLLELAAHYRFEPRPVAVARGNEKGRVERAIRFVRDAFFAARPFRDLDDLNAQADAWCQGAAAERLCPEDRTRSVRTVFAEEQPRLLALPENPFPAEERIEVSVGKTPYVRFDLNDYTVPHTHVSRMLSVLATLDTVRILEGSDVIATHSRSFERDAQIEDPAHVEALVTHKRAARAHRAQDRLQHAAPSVKPLFLRAAERGAHLGVLTRGLLALLDTHGAHALEAAIAAALAEDAAHLGAVRHFIDRHAHARGQVPPIAVVLPADPRLHALNVRPQALSDYEHLTPESPDERAHDDDEPQP